MKTVEFYLKVRRACHRDGMSERQAAKYFGCNRRTIAKILKHSVPPGYRRRKPKLDPYTGIIDQILEDDKDRPRKQRHTAKRIQVQSASTIWPPIRQIAIITQISVKPVKQGFDHPGFGQLLAVNPDRFGIRHAVFNTKIKKARLPHNHTQSPIQFRLQGGSGRFRQNGLFFRGSL